MDTKYDFTQPEFLNILFFQQKNLIIFPYIDLKHLKSLEIFTIGYNIIDLEGTALFNLKEIIEYEASNSYSQNKSLFFIYNIDRNTMEEIIKIPDIRCIINTNENVSDFVKHKDYIIYNKKNKKFLNYNSENINLGLENDLLSSSENRALLNDKIQKIKTAATKIFTEINMGANLKKIIEILSEYNQNYWNKILTFVELYFNIEVPNINSLKKNSLLLNIKTNVNNNERGLKDFSNEYELIITQNNNIAKEFVQLLHEYRSKNVNSSNLDLDQLYNPQKLYNYLRNHHWAEQISENYLSEWTQMQNSGYKLKQEDYSDFKIIFQKLKVPKQAILKLLDDKTNNYENIAQNQGKTKESQDNGVLKDKEPNTSNVKESIKNFPKFKKELLKKLDDIERIIEKTS